MSNSKGRRLFREYAQHQGKEAKEFVKIEENFGGDTLITKGSNGKIENTHINYKDILHLIIAKKIGLNDKDK